MPTDDPAPEEDIQQEPDYQPRDAYQDEMDDVTETSDPYDASGNARWENPEGEPVDFFGNVIPATRPQAEEPEAPSTEPASVSPVPQRPQYRSPFADGIFTESEQERYDAILDAETQELIDKRLMGMVDRAITARDQQRAAARDLGIPEDRFDEVSQMMARAEYIVPRELRGTKAGANIALAAAMVERAGPDGSIFDIMREFGTPRTQPTPAPATPQRQPVPAMPPSQRSVQARPAPDHTRQNRAPKMIGTLTQDQLAVIRAERKTVKNGR